ncbi:MAG: hypothetical protein JXA23_11730 [Bacteroidales bacterium]|nr:hypothetical protein [Bacteroidales bacterium]
MNKVLIVDRVHPLIWEELTAHGFVCESFPDYSREQLEEMAGTYTGIIIRSRFRIDQKFLNKASNLRFIGRIGSGLDAIDVEYATAKGIRCFNSPEGNRDSVGEHTLGMLLSMLNHLNRADRQVRNGIWNRRENWGTELKGKTVGIIGYGNMGSAFARRLKGFETHVIAYDKYKRNYSDGNVRETTLDELCENADIVSLHVPLTDETTFLVDTSFLNRFRRKIWLINTSRGKVVKTSCLVNALKSGKVLGAALDVLEYEDASFEALATDLPEDFRYLMESGNVILTPHIAGWTDESNVKLAKVLVEKIVKWKNCE